MVPQGTIETVARIVDYNRFRKPSAEEFIDGFKYEYVQFAFSKVLSHLPDLDETGRKPTCTYRESWREGTWGSPFGIIHKEYINQAMKKEQIRVRKKLTTKYLRDLLGTKPLEFRWRSMHIVIFPKKLINHDGTEILDTSNIYVNGVTEKLIRTKPESKLNKRWFCKSKDEKEGIKEDWRYLLELDHPEQPAKNILYRYFEGVFTGDEAKFKNICDNYIDGKLEEKEYQPANSNKKSQTINRAEEYAEKKRLKDEKKNSDPKDMSTSRLHKPKVEELLSKAVVEARKEVRLRRLRRSVDDKIREIQSLRKIRAKKESQVKNSKWIHAHELVTIRSTLTKDIFRVPRYKAEQYTKKWFTYIPKSKWKSYKSEIRTIKKNEAEDKYEWKTSEIKNPPLLHYGWNPEGGKEKEGCFEMITSEPKNPDILIRVIPNFNGVNRKAQRSDPKKKKVFNRECTIEQVIDSKNNPVMEKAAITVPDPKFEQVQVFQTTYELDDKGKVIYDKDKMSGKKIKRVKSVKPWMIPGFDKDGNETLVPVYNRVIKKNTDGEIDTRIIKFLKTKMQKLRKVVKLKTTLKR